MKGKGFAAIAAAGIALGLAGCSGQTEEEEQAGKPLRELLQVESRVISAQEEAIEDLNEPFWNHNALSKNLADGIRPRLERLRAEAKNQSGPETRKAVSSVSKSAAKTGFAMEELLEPVQGIKKLANAVSGWNNGDQAQLVRQYSEPYGLRVSLRAAERVEPDLPSLLEDLEASTRAASDALDEIETRLDETGNLGDDEKDDLAEARDSIDFLESTQEEALENLGDRYTDEMARGSRALEQARQKSRAFLANQLPDGACAQIPVPYPSTLGSPSVYVYVFPGRVSCDLGIAAAKGFYEDASARETGSTVLTPDNPDAPSFECDLSQISPIGEPRIVNCEGDWEGETLRISFEAPSTAG